MIAVALKGLAGRKLRALLTAFAVVIGVSMVSGTFILTDTMQKTFDGLFAASYEDTDAVIAGKEIVESSMSGAATIPESLLDEGPGAARGRGRGRHRLARPRATPPTSSAATARPSPRRASASASTPPTRSSARSSSRPATGRRARTQVVDRRRHRREGALRGRRLDRRLHVGARARLHGHRHRVASATSTRSASAASPPGTSRPPRRCSTARACSTRSRSPPRTAPRRPSSSRPCGRCSRARSEVKDSAEQAEEDAAEIDEGMAYDPLLPARLRRHRAVRRRVRDLQHAVDHGRPAHARVRDAAHARRVAQAGAALGAARGPRDRPRGLGDRALPRLRDREGDARAVQRDGRRPAGGAGRFALRTVIVSLLLGTGITLLASDHAGAPGDPRAADRGGPRGRDAAGVALRGALAQGGARRDAAVARRDLGRRLRRRAERERRRGCCSGAA